jgi:hypothetical protein
VKRVLQNDILCVGLPAEVQPEVVVIRAGRRAHSSSSEDDEREAAQREQFDSEQGAVGGVGISDKQVDYNVFLLPVFPAHTCF